ncbi:MAG: DHH family phosphoesterase [Methanospirillaceae archaeon]|nr:DHH family phosphoesterase [Methanospirillaceae archaeon]
MSLAEDVREAVAVIQNHNEVTIISHIDADGITSETILSLALSRAGINTRSIFIRQLDPLTLHAVPDDSQLTIFSDLGSGQQSLIMEKNLFPDDVIIVDHHVSQPADAGYHEVNALTHGYEKLSAAGVAYMVAKELDNANIDLAKLAIIGNVGDMMDREDLCLSGPAREILADGIGYGNIELWERDLNIYGISTRPLPQALAYTDDLLIPGISQDLPGTKRFLQRLGIVPDERKHWPVWQDISFSEKQMIVTAIVEQMVAAGRPVNRLFADHYLFLDEKMSQSPLRNASEYATLLNSCGRWSRPALGDSICRGDRGGAYTEAYKMLKNHRNCIREVLQYIVDTGVSELSHILYLHVGDRFPDTIVGIGAGMALSRLNPQKPILIMCVDQMDPENTKVSMRTKPDVIAQGVNLQEALCESAAKYGGSGGGHRIAAGAFIPKTAEKEFVYEVNETIRRQLA